MCLNENSRVISEEHVCPPRLELDEHGSLASGVSCTAVSAYQNLYLFFILFVF